MSENDDALRAEKERLQAENDTLRAKLQERTEQLRDVSRTALMAYMEATESRKEFEAAAYSDSLTGLESRYGFEQTIVENLKTAPPEPTSNSAYEKRIHANAGTYAIILIDADKFKEINDKFSHSIGDEVLKGIAERLTLHLREQDTLRRGRRDQAVVTEDRRAVRWGGEEFVVALPWTDEKGAEAVAERIRADIEEHVKDPQGESVTVSLGVAIGSVEDVHKLELEAVRTVIHDADRAMYEAKNSGRNRVVLYNQEPDQ